MAGFDRAKERNGHDCNKIIEYSVFGAFTDFLLQYDCNKIIEYLCSQTKIISYRCCKFI